jgi:hypothetical protein
MRFNTQNCHTHGHPEFSIEGGAQPGPPNLPWFLQWLEEAVAGGSRFAPEQTVQIGWSVCMVRAREDGTLALFEPDFQSMPVQFVDLVANTLFHLLLQKYVAESLGMSDAIDIPSLQQSAIVCSNFGKTKGFVMSREKEEGHASGWFFGCADPSHHHNSADTLRLVSLYEAAVGHEAQVIPYLGLPPGTFVGWEETVPYFVRGRKKLTIIPGSYLHQKYAQKTG